LTAELKPKLGSEGAMIWNAGPEGLLRRERSLRTSMKEPGPNFSLSSNFALHFLNTTTRTKRRLTAMNKKQWNSTLNLTPLPHKMYIQLFESINLDTRMELRHFI